MSLDYITAESFKLYNTVQQKENELKSIDRNSNGNVLFIILGIPFAFSHGYGLAIVDDFSFSKILFFGSLTVGGIAACGYGMRELVQGHRHKKALRNEIKELKASLDYQQLEKMLE